jgi:hypothetical protein
MSADGWKNFAALSALGESVLDIGCAAGEPMATYLVKHGYSVTGVDSSRALRGSESAIRLRPPLTQKYPSIVRPSKARVAPAFSLIGMDYSETLDRGSLG